MRKIRKNCMNVFTISVYGASQETGSSFFNVKESQFSVMEVIVI